MPGSSGAGDLVRKTAHLVLGIASLSGHVLSLSPALLSLVVLVTMLVVVLILFVGGSSDPGPDGGADAFPDAATDPMRSRSSAAEVLVVRISGVCFGTLLSNNKLASRLPD